MMKITSTIGYETKKIKLSAYIVVFRIKYRVGDCASNMETFLWGKAIGVIRTTRRLLTESKPWN